MYNDLKGDIFSQGFHVVPSKIMLSEDLKALDKLVYIVLLGFSVKGKADVSMIELAGVANLDRKEISKHLNNLEDAGLIIKEAHKKKTRRGKLAQIPNTYYIQNEVK